MRGECPTGKVGFLPMDRQQAASYPRKEASRYKSPGDRQEKLLWHEPQGRRARTRAGGQVSGLKPA